MNERIEKLAEQCYAKTGSPHTDHFEYWKFAELLVKECAELARQHNLKTADRSHLIHKAIKEHFGIENLTD